MKKQVLIGLTLMISCFIVGGAYIAISTHKVIDKLERVASFHQVKYLRKTLEQHIKGVQTDLLLQGSPHSRNFETITQQIEATADSAAGCRSCHHSTATSKRLANAAPVVCCQCSISCPELFSSLKKLSICHRQ